MNDDSERKSDEGRHPRLALSEIGRAWSDSSRFPSTSLIAKEATMLLDKIQAASLEARKAKDAEKASLLTTLLAEAARIGKDDGNRITTDAETSAVVRKFIKGIDESLPHIKDDAARDRALREKAVLVTFMPQMVTGSALVAAVQEIVAGLAEKSPKQMGAVMKALKDRFAGAYDGTEASAVVKVALQ
jgi:uncharacterized protein